MAIDGRLLDGKVAVITGSTRGIGRAVAEEFVLHGASVVVTGRHERDVTEVVDALGPMSAGISGDMADEAWPAQLLDFAVRSFGKVDVFVNNSGFPISGPISELSDHDLNEILSVNLASFLRCAREAAGQLALNHGSLINMSSVYGLRGRKHYSAYSATKAAALGLTKSLALEWASEDVRVNGIAPGYIATRINEQARADEDLHRRMSRKIPLGRFGEPRDVAAAAVFLASDMAAYITGHTLVVDGGFVVA